MPPNALDTDAKVSKTLSALAKAEHADPAVAPLLDQLSRCTPERVARVGLERYPALRNHSTAWNPVWETLGTLTDVTTLVPAFLEVWRKPKNKYWYGDLRLPEPFFDLIVGHPEVRAQMNEDLVAAEAVTGNDDSLVRRRGGAAAGLLARVPAELVTLVALVRRWRDRPRRLWFDTQLYTEVLKALARSGDRRAYPTLLLDLASMQKPWDVYRHEIAALVRLDRERTRRYVMALFDAGAMTQYLVPLLEHFGDDDARSRLRMLAMHPDPKIRMEARTSLSQQGHDIEAPFRPAPLEDLIADPHAETRHHAIRTLFSRKELALFASLVAADALDYRLKAIAGNERADFDWNEWARLIPAEVIGGSYQEKLAWARGPGARVLGPQTILPAIASVLERGVDAVAADYPRPRLQLTDDERQALLAEEAAVLP